MDKYQIYTALQNMDRFGGSFVQALACCYSLADPNNKTILLNAFEPTFKNTLILIMDKKKAIDFILDIFRENEKNPPEKYLCRKDIVDILHVDFKVPESTGYRYHSEAEKEYMWELEKSNDPKKKIDRKQVILDNLWDIVQSYATKLGKPTTTAEDNQNYTDAAKNYSNHLKLYKKV